SAIRHVLETFSGLPDRLEKIRTWRGILFVNDTTATTPDATIAALDAFTQRPEYKNADLHLIFGGADKELQFQEVASVIESANIHIYVLPGTAQDKIIKSFHAANILFQSVPDLREAMRLIRQRAKKGDVVLLSPGCASFGLFKNEFDRGEQFKKIVSRLP
ncbi:MAG TPA: cyanophycin synthetase, partial [Patescibacteria group bacterium]|nr:cyanophycin synthetase [Patescibacteria group bacterium]